MKTIRNFVFICLLLYVSSLSMKHGKAQSLLQTNLNHYSLMDRASNFRMYGQFLEADCKTSTGQTKLCRLNINRRIGFKGGDAYQCSLERGTKFLDYCQVTSINKDSRHVVMDTRCVWETSGFLFRPKNKNYGYPSFNLDTILGVDEDGNMTFLDYLEKCTRCWLDKHKYKCNCYDNKGKIKTSELNLEKRLRNKNGQLEFFFKGFQKSCRNLSLKSNHFVTAQCTDPNKNWRDTTLDLSNYFYLDNGKIKSY